MPSLEIFQHVADTLRFEPGQVLFSQGDARGPMLVVVEGTVDILVNGTLVESVGPGGVIGEMALIDPGPRSATVKARSAGTYVEVHEQRFLFLVQNTPYFALEMMQILAARLRRADTMINR